MLILLATFYYETYYGSYPFDTFEEFNITSNTISYLKDNGFSEECIAKILMSIGKKACIKFNDLPEAIWEDSILKKDVFYFHRELQLPTPVTVMNEDGSFVTPSFRLEMKIKYSVEDILSYFYQQTQYALELRNKEKDLGSINYLLKRYDKIDFMEPVDFILSLIDFAKNKAYEDYDTLEYKDILTVNNQYAAEALKHIKQRVKLSQASGYGKIIWRE